MDEVFVPVTWYNKVMKKRKGFTLVEVVLFLAVSAMLFVGIIAGTGNSLQQQRYNDSVQNFVEFLRSVYSQVSNPQSVGGGNSDYALYGRLISFGQTVGFDGETTDDAGITGDAQRIYVYDVIGKVDLKMTSGGLGELIKNLQVSVAKPVEIDGGWKVEPAGQIETYLTRWSATIENTGKDADGKKIWNNPEDLLYKGSILVIRNPQSGTINTLVNDAVFDINEEIRKYNDDRGGPIGTARSTIVGGSEESRLREALGKWFMDYYGDVNNPNFKPQEVDFCVNPYGVGVTNLGQRRNVRILRNSRNASGVLLIDLDSEDNKCRQ